MNRVLIRRIIIIITFVVSLIFFSIFMNQGSTDMTEEMKEATLPVAGIIIDGRDVNQMHGYTRKMNEASMRDAISPIEEDRKITFYIEKFSGDIAGVSYEVRSVDGERLIEAGEIASYDETKDRIEATITLKDLIKSGQEYNFILIPKLEDGRNVYYYTRIIQMEEVYPGEKLDFVKDFHDKTFDKTQAESLARYIEPTSDGDNTTFGRVDIHSSWNQLTWGDMNVKEVEEPIYNICEIGEQTAGIQVKSIVEVEEGRVRNTYRVEEYFRIRYTDERVYLLNYERTMEEIFLMEKSSFANNKIVLGIQKEDVSMEESDGGNILAFVNAGRIYSYNVEENKFSKLFAFMDQDNFDARTLFDQSDIEIIDVEENGNVTFAVCGYMNRGRHEGEVGVEICYYNSQVNAVEEQIFINYEKSPKILLSETDRFFYAGNSGKVYLLLDGTLYEVNISGKKYTEIVTGLGEDSVQISKSNRMLVWQEDDEKLILMDFNSGKTEEIKAGFGEHIKPIGFMNEDIIYGIAGTEDIQTDPLGNELFPMKKVVIRAVDGSILKSYEEENIYVTEGTIESNQITLKRVLKKEGTSSYEIISDDQITSNAEVEEGTNKAMVVATDLYEKIWQIELKREVDTRNMKFYSPQEVLYEGGRSLTISAEEMPKRYYVYAKGEVFDTYQNANNAVEAAYHNIGTVFDEEGREIYKRGETRVLNQIMAIKGERITAEKNSLAVCLDTMLKLEGMELNTENMVKRGESAISILSKNIKECDVLNLKGCTMDTMLYYLDRDIPVLVHLKSGNALLVIGFNQQQIVIMDPITGSLYKKGQKDAKAMFEENGNLFLTYAKYPEE